MPMMGSVIMVWGFDHPDMQFVDKTAMTITTTLTGSVSPYFFTVNNLDTNVFFAVNSLDPYGLYRIPIPASGTTYTWSHSSASTNFIYSNILNFGPYQYIGLVRTEDPALPFMMYSKLDVTIFEVPLPPITGLNPGDASLVQGPSEGNKFFLALQSTLSGSNFQSYYILFDVCLCIDARTQIFSSL